MELDTIGIDLGKQGTLLILKAIGDTEFYDSDISRQIEPITLRHIPG